MPKAESIRYGSSAKTGKETTEKLHVNFRPLGTKLVVRPISGEQTTKSGLIIPDNAMGEKPQEGWIIAIGAEVDQEAKQIKVGDRVLFSKYAGDEIRIRDEKGIDNELKILHFESLLGVIDSPHDEQEDTPKVESPEVRPDEKSSDGKSSGTKRVKNT